MKPLHDYSGPESSDTVERSLPTALTRATAFGSPSQPRSRRVIFMAGYSQACEVATASLVRGSGKAYRCDGRSFPENGAITTCRPSAATPPPGNVKRNVRFHQVQKLLRKESSCPRCRRRSLLRGRSCPRLRYESLEIGRWCRHFLRSFAWMGCCGTLRPVGGL
jgi:hypothetical protein